MNPDLAIPDLARHDTAPKLVRLHARGRGGEVIWREKHLGSWRPMTGAQVAERVRDFALGFDALGIGRGDVVGLIGDSRPDWLAGEYAAHAVRAMSLGIYRDALDHEVAYLLNHAQAKLVVAEEIGRAHV